MFFFFSLETSAYNYLSRSWIICRAYICSLDVFVFIDHVFHFGVDFVADHFLLLGIYDVLLEFVCIVLFGEVVGDVQSIDGLFVHFMNFDIVLLLFYQFFSGLDRLNRWFFTSNCFFNLVASWSIFLAYLVLPASTYYLALAFITSILTSYFLTFWSNDSIFWERLFVTFSDCILLAIFSSSAFCLWSAAALACCSWGVGLL